MSRRPPTRVITPSSSTSPVHSFWTTTRRGCARDPPPVSAPPLPSGVLPARRCNNPPPLEAMTTPTLLSTAQDDTALAARALAHPLRARALELLTRSPASPQELAKDLGAPLTIVSYHVRMLAHLGFIELVAT